MGYGKYTTTERYIAIQIYKLKERQSKYRKKWLELDVKILALKHQLKGKYEEKR